MAPPLHSYCSLISSNNTSNLSHSLSWRGKVGRKLLRLGHGGSGEFRCPLFSSSSSHSSSSHSKTLLTFPKKPPPPPPPFHPRAVSSFSPSYPQGVRVTSVAPVFRYLPPRDATESPQNSSLASNGVELISRAFTSAHTHTQNHKGKPTPVCQVFDVM